MIKINDVLKTLLKMIGIVVGAAIIGTILLWCVYKLPVEPMAKNVAASEDVLRAQNDSEFLVNEEYWKTYDLGTNIIMFFEVIQPSSGSALQDALLVPNADYISRWWENWTDVLMEYANDRVYSESDHLTYARYWHGYLVFLKPLFLFFKLDVIYIINAIVLIVLSFANIYFINKRLGNYWIAYVLGIFVMHPINIVQSFQLSTVFYAMQITLLLLMIREKWKYEQMMYIFVLDGILVAFLDFLTYPLVAFAVPALFAYLIEKKEIKQAVFDLISQGFSFVVGYVGMWGMKWIVATVFTKENVIMDAINSVLHRTGVTENTNDVGFMSIGVPDALERNLLSFFNEQNNIIIFISVLVLGICVFVKRKSLRLNASNLVVCSIIASSSFAWIILLSNHCSLHPHLEWRTFSVLIFAIIAFMMSLFESKTQKR